MALAVSITAIENGQTTETVYGTIVASATYTAGGDTLNLSGFDQIKSGSAPIQCYIQSQKAGGNTGWWYSFVPGTTLANGKMQVFGTGTSSGASHNELGNGVTYSAQSPSIAGDTIVFCAIFNRI